jgi:hypothetical protein
VPVWVARKLKASDEGVDMWREGASDLWGRLEGEEAACMEAIRGRINHTTGELQDRAQNSSTDESRITPRRRKGRSARSGR